MRRRRAPEGRILQARLSKDTLLSGSTLLSEGILLSKDILLSGGILLSEGVLRPERSLLSVRTEGPEGPVRSGCGTVAAVRRA